MFRAETRRVLACSNLQLVQWEMWRLRGCILRVRCVPRGYDI